MVLSFFGICEAATGFALHGMIYSGRKENNAPHQNLANDIVMNLCSVYYGIGRDIYVDRYFTTHELVCNLLFQKITLIGTFMSISVIFGNSVSIQIGRGEVESTKALCDHSNGILLILYIPKRNRNVLMMSSSHFDVSIADYHSKSTVIIDYDKHKGGVDTPDENCKEFNCLRKTNR